MLEMERYNPLDQVEWYAKVEKIADLLLTTNWVQLE